MGHFGGGHLPVYKHLAHNFCVCDRWHSSVPGDTWPNRLYSLAGREADSIVERASFLERLRDPTFWRQIKNLPIYDVEAFTRHLRDEQWRWYSYDAATLRAADDRYRDEALFDRDNFTYVDQKRIGLVQQAADVAVVTRDSFLDDAAKGELR